MNIINYCMSIVAFHYPSTVDLTKDTAAKESLFIREVLP